VLVRWDGFASVRVEVTVRLSLVVGVGVGVEDAAAPPHQQAHRERHDDGPYRHLRCLLDPLGQVLSEEHEG
jgi:hypothetical protein